MGIGRVTRSRCSLFEQAGSPKDFIVDVVAPPGGPVESLWLAVDEAKRLAGDFFR